MIPFPISKIISILFGILHWVRINENMHYYPGYEETILSAYYKIYVKDVLSQKSKGGRREV